MVKRWPRAYLCELRTRQAMLETIGHDSPEMRAEIPGFAEPLLPAMALVPEAAAVEKRGA